VEYSFNDRRFAGGRLLQRKATRIITTASAKNHPTEIESQIPSRVTRLAPENRPLLTCGGRLMGPRRETPRLNPLCIDRATEPGTHYRFERSSVSGRLIQTTCKPRLQLTARATQTISKATGPAPRASSSPTAKSPPVTRAAQLKFLKG
jgi:hypothetical protein